MKKLKISTLSLVVALFLPACGQGVDTLKILDSGIPQLGPIIANSFSWPTLQTPFSTSTPYWTFNSATWGAGFMLAPADGTISEIGTSTLAGGSNFYVKIIHSGRMSSTVHGLSVVNLRVGDVVAAGSSVGTFFNSGLLSFQVILDNVAVCPMSFLSSAFRLQLQSAIVINPCQQ